MQEDRSIPIAQAQESGAMMLFGEKYGDTVRMITFDKDFSRELCGGCHVDSTGQIGIFKIVSESGIAAGVRRITAITSEYAQQYLTERLEELESIKSMFKNPNNVVGSVADLQEENKKLKREIEKLQADKAGDLKGDLKNKVRTHNGVNVLAERVEISDAKAAKTLLFNLEKEVGNGVFLFGLVSNEKPQLMLMISKEIVESKGWHAGKIVKEIAKEINGGGGGQAFFATAGGSKSEGLEAAIDQIENHLS